MIHILPPEIANRIAAGEVVERPASVVRELIDNSIDAGAHRIDVEVRDGGLGLIRVTDDGVGMSCDDAALSVKRHATSKIQTGEDLESITTKGFRGEALAAIASVSKFEIKTRLQGDEWATRLYVEGGIEQAPEQTGAPTGTTVSVSDLFYNTPARRKFLKKPATELGHVLAAINTHALAHESIHFTFTNNQNRSLDLPAVANRPERIKQIFGGAILNEMIPVHFESPILSISGFISRPTLTRNGAQHLFFFVNDRYVKDRLLHRAVMNGYRNLLPTGRYPVVFLHFQLAPSEIDINVHPTKQEIKFSREDAVFSAVYGSIRQSWDKREEAKQDVQHVFDGLDDEAPSRPAKIEMPPKATWSRPTPPEAQTPTQPSTAPEAQPIAAPPREEPQPPAQTVETQPAREETPPASTSEPAQQTETPQVPTAPQTPAASNPIEQLNRKPVGDEKPLQSSEAAFHDLYKAEKRLDDVFEAVSLEGVEPLQVIGQLLNSYILAESKEGFYLIDQHAAHERLMFEKFLVQSQNASIAKQALLFPMTIDLSSPEAVWIEDQTEMLNHLGFEIEPFGPQTIILRTLPSHINADQAEAFLKDLLGEMQREGSVAEKQERALHTMACRAAVKFGDRLTHEDMTGIIRGLESIPRRNVCPHGRPSILYVGDGDLRKLFKRTGFD
ncbi:DNA mismatch repair endonuclease MutL [bacterium]|nr:DNA mismatch repair endonuclease MutL [bacterium]